MTDNLNSIEKPIHPFSIIYSRYDPYSQLFRLPSGPHAYRVRLTNHQLGEGKALGVKFKLRILEERKEGEAQAAEKLGMFASRDSKNKTKELSGEQVK